MNTHDKDYLFWCLDKNLDPDNQKVFESYVFRNLTSNETMLEQIRRLNLEQARVHEQRRLEAINKIRARRLVQKQKETQ